MNDDHCAIPMKTERPTLLEELKIRLDRSEEECLRLKNAISTLEKQPELANLLQSVQGLMY